MPSVFMYLLVEDSEYSPCGSMRHGMPSNECHLRIIVSVRNVRSLVGHFTTRL